MVKAATVVPMHYGFATGGSPQRFALAVGDTAQVVVLAPALPYRCPVLCACWRDSWVCVDAAGDFPNSIY
ncbi:MAG: hypothetical protein V3S37_05310, partial [Dehalococcoidia bacterium]